MPQYSLDLNYTSQARVLEAWPQIGAKPLRGGACWGVLEPLQEQV